MEPSLHNPRRHPFFHPDGRGYMSFSQHQPLPRPGVCAGCGRPLDDHDMRNLATPRCWAQGIPPPMSRPPDVPR